MVKTSPSFLQGVQVRSLFMELRSHKPCGQKLKHKTRNILKFNRLLKWSTSKKIKKKKKFHSISRFNVYIECGEYKGHGILNELASRNAELNCRQSPFK